MTYTASTEMQLTYDSTVGGFQQMVEADENSVDLVAITVATLGGWNDATDSYCKIFIPNIHGGDVDDIWGLAFLEDHRSITFVCDPGGIGDVYIAQQTTSNDTDFQVKWFPTLIGRGSANLVDPSMPFTGNRAPNWQYFR